MSSLSHQLVFNGAVLLLVGFVAGMPFTRAIKTGGREVAWRIVHSGSTMAGVMLLALGPIAPTLGLPSWGIAALVWSLIVGSHAFVVGMVIAAMTGNRGLSREGSATNRVVLVLYQLGAVLSLTASALLVLGAALAL